MVKKQNKRYCVTLVILVAVLVFCAVELAAYFIRSQNNQAEQMKLAAQHLESLRQAQTAAAIPTVTQTPSAAPAQPKAAVITAAPLATVYKAAFFQVIGLTQDAMKPIVRQNGDAVGWLTIEGLVDQPLVYKNNTFYLTHDFYSKKNVSGALFVDEKHPLRQDTQNLLVYGHNMKDGSMFGRLIHYTENNFLHSHYTVRLETRFESFTYLIFAVDKVSTDYHSRNFLYFWGYPAFNSENEFNQYISDVYAHSLYTRYLDVDYSDTLLTMATCLNESRLVLFARRLREDETEADIQHALLGLYRK